jgi:diketogulonate reductase-like aldo/keto reductase
MTLLSRAQFWLSEDNLGQASEDVTSARAMIFAQAEKWREETEYGDRVTVLDEIVSRLDIALEDIRTQPSIAEDEIEIAWKLLIVVTAPEHLGAE